jgi:hypothetical protein
MKPMAFSRSPECGILAQPRHERFPRARARRQCYEHINIQEAGGVLYRKNYSTVQESEQIPESAVKIGGEGFKI